MLEGWELFCFKAEDNEAAFKSPTRPSTGYLAKYRKSAMNYWVGCEQDKAYNIARAKQKAEWEAQAKVAKAEKEAKEKVAKAERIARLEKLKPVWASAWAEAYPDVDPDEFTLATLARFEEVLEGTAFDPAYALRRVVIGWAGFRAYARLHGGNGHIELPAGPCILELWACINRARPWLGEPEEFNDPDYEPPPAWHAEYVALSDDELIKRTLEHQVLFDEALAKLEKIADGYKKAGIIPGAYGSLEEEDLKYDASHSELELRRLAKIMELRGLPTPGVSHDLPLDYVLLRFDCPLRRDPCRPVCQHARHLHPAAVGSERGPCREVGVKIRGADPARSTDPLAPVEATFAHAWDVVRRLPSPIPRRRVTA